MILKKKIVSGIEYLICLKKIFLLTIDDSTLQDKDAIIESKIIIIPISIIFPSSYIIKSIKKKLVEICNMKKEFLLKFPYNLL